MTPALTSRHGRFASRLLLAGALFLGGLLRLWSGMASTGTEGFWNDEWEYYGIGVQAADTGQFRPLPGWVPTAFRMPLYPAAISLARKVKPGIKGARLLNAAADTAVIVAVYAAAAMTAGGLAGGVAACLYAFFGPAIQAVRAPGLEPFFGLLVALSLAVWTDSLRRKGVRPMFFSAVLLGLTLACRSTLFLMPLVLAWVLPAQGWRIRLRNLCILALGSLFFVLPWTLRNASMFRAFIPFENGAISLNLWGASVGLLESPAVPRLIGSPEHRDFLSRTQKAPDLDRPRLFLAESLRNVRRDPLPFLKNFFRRLPLLWREQWLLLLLALPLLAGWSRPGVTRGRGAWVALAMLGYFSLQSFLAVTPRYARPAAAAACVAASLGVLSALRRMGPTQVRFSLVPAEAWPGRFSALAVLACAAVWAVSAGQVLAEAWRWRGRFIGVPAEYLSAPAYYGTLKKAEALAVDQILENRTSDADYLLSEILVREPAFTEARWNRAWLRRLVRDRAGRAADLRELTLAMEFPKGLAEERVVRLRLAEF